VLSDKVYQLQVTAAAHFAHIHALPLAASGTCSITEGEKTTSMHQQRSSSLPVAFDFSIAQMFSS